MVKGFRGKTLAKAPQNLNTFPNTLIYIHIQMYIYIKVWGFRGFDRMYNHNARACAHEGFQGF